MLTLQFAQAALYLYAAVQATSIFRRQSVIALVGFSFGKYIHTK